MKGADAGAVHRLRQYVGVAAITVSLSLALAANGSAAAPPRPAAGGTLTVAVEEDCKGFDAIKVGILNTSARSAMVAVEERLFDMDSKGRLVPELGLSAAQSKDGKSWTIKLRKGVYFHDGASFDADAVVSHWERLIDPKNHYRALSVISPVASVQKIDDHTVQFKLKHPWLPFKDVISSPLGFAAFIPSPKAVQAGTQDRAPVGTGPFRFKEWLPNDRVVLTRNPNYWQKGKPYLDGVVFRVVPDMQTRFAALKSGEVDVILTDRGASILQAKEDRSLKVYSSSSTGAETFLLNTSKAPLNDVRVRRALAHAWNQEFYIKASYKDTIPVARDPYGGIFACGDLGYRGYDPEKARKLVTEYGKPVNLELQITNTQRGKEFGEIVQRMFKEIGVTVTLKPLALGQRNKLVFAGDYQMTGWALFDNADMAPILYNNLLSSSEMNFSRYQNADMDRFLTAMQTSISPKERQKAFCGAAKHINEEAVFLYRGGLRYNAIAKAEVAGISRIDHAVVQVRDLWWSNPERRVASVGRK